MLPSSFSDLLVKLTTDILFLGMATALIVGGLVRFLQSYWPGHGYQLPSNWLRLISLLLPFVLALAAYGGHVLTTSLLASWEGVYQIIVTATMAATGKQLAYTGYQAVKSLAPKVDDPALVPAKVQVPVSPPVSGEDH